MSRRPSRPSRSLVRSRSVRFKPLVVLAAVMAVGIVPTSSLAAGPKNVWVSSGPASAADSSCAKPGYNTIQSAINAAPTAARIHVCAGTYVEALTITKPVSLVAIGSVSVQLPAAPAISTTACDTAPGTGGFQPDQDAITICASGTVNLTGLTIDAAWPAGTCNDSLYGILVAGGATLNLLNSSIVAAGAVPLNGCQGGVGIQVGMAWTTPVEVGHANLSNVKISGYQKNGVTVDGAGSSANISTTALTGIGPTISLAQNGIQISNGAMGRVHGSTISGNECDVSVCGPDILNSTQAIGVLFYGAAAGSSVTGSKISGNDVGVYTAAQIAPVAPAVSILADGLIANRYAGILLDQGWTAVSGDSIIGGNVGIGVLQYNGQAFAANGTASLDVIRNASIAAVQVASDQAPAGDRPGTLSLSFSQLRGNAARVLHNSSDYRVSPRFLD